MMITGIIGAITASASAVAALPELIDQFSKYRNGRRERKMEELKNICPHATVGDVKEKGENEEVHIETLYHRPNADSEFICSQCGKIAVSQEEVDISMDEVNKEMRKNPFFITEQNDEYQKKSKN